MNTNSENPGVGKAFQEKVRKAATEQLEKCFIPEKAIPIGNPPTEHKFDLVSEDGEIIIECKCYTWTKSWNVPSAKMATLDEAILYLRSVSYPATKIIVLDRAFNRKTGHTLAEYFVAKKRHLLEDVQVMEFDGDNYLRSLTNSILN